MGRADPVGRRRLMGAGAPIAEGPVVEGWYPDPEDVTARGLRHWDGEDWSPIPAKLASRSERERLSWPGEDPEAAARLKAARRKPAPKPVLIAYMVLTIGWLLFVLIDG